MSDPLASAQAFLEEDPDPETRAELRELLGRVAKGDADARSDLDDRFSGPLTFGTAGLRGRVEAGLARMNRVVVVKATWGLGTHLLESNDAATRQGVVVAFDGRRSSRQFAEDAASVFCGLGLPVYLFSDPVPTPLGSFAVPLLGAAGGVVVTASHNPPLDNGYKVYLASGAQIAPPVDIAIARCIERAPSLPEITRMTPADAAGAGLRRMVDTTDRRVEDAYLAGLARESLHPPEGPSLRLAYTALHGVGHRLVVRALARAGFEGMATVASQADPDGTFPTVQFPNPEEPGAMERVLALAETTGAELVLANDPDADRLAAAVPDPEGSGYRMLSGNELGVLLADDAMEHAEVEGRQKLVVTTVVSSTLLSRMARDRKVSYRETLTGFKWIVKAALDAEERGEAFVFGYEEALGYCVSPLVRDKDGIGAALRLAELARHLKTGGRTLLGRVDELLVAHGLSHPVQWSVTLPGPEGKGRIDGAMKTLRARPLGEVGGSPVVRVVDAQAGLETVDGEERPIELPRSNLVTFEAASGARLTARPSGTEPKIKFYLELAERVETVEDVAPTRSRLEKEGQDVRLALLDQLGLA